MFLSEDNMLEARPLSLVSACLYVCMFVCVYEFAYYLLSSILSGKNIDSVYELITISWYKLSSSVWEIDTLFFINNKIYFEKKN